MIFAARQLVEKARKHDESLFILFVDLKNAYNFVPRNALWRVLDRITSQQLALTFRMEEPIEDILMQHRLRWLGHLGSMAPDRIPTILLFGELEKKRLHQTCRP